MGSPSDVMGVLVTSGEDTQRRTERRKPREDRGGDWG